MLGLGVGFYGLGGKTYNGGDWLPTDESSLVAWYKFGTPTKNPVDAWPDSSGNSHHMVQATSASQPTISSGIITFDGSNDFLKTASQISITGEFTVGIRFNSTTTGRVLLGDNTENNEFFKIIDSNTIRIKTSNATASGASSTANMDISDGSTWGDSHIIATRDGSNDMRIWHNGVEQTPASAQTLTLTMQIDAIGVRNDNNAAGTNFFDGDMYEIQIFNTKSDDLTANIITRLASL